MAIIPERKEYNRSTLLESDVASDPIRQFQAWYESAIAAGLDEPNAMTLATASRDGKPSARIVLLKAYDEQGFRFFTNDQSQKVQDLSENPRAALVFFWQAQERQVRVVGPVERVSEAEADAYFSSRPAESRLGAWASDQSRVVSNREAIETRFEEVFRSQPEGDIPRPPHWGGYRVVPELVEFWQGRPSRLHDRLVYRRQPGGDWIIERLWP